ncbi:alpha-1,2-fucosyltransferase [Polynucleobacter sp. HIN8]|uniref:alpha-1,2-fucosyltransferase n=1 Tax=Polynucleobacter sp. HIN8 TaxID=3047867 RepID=UPI0025738E36|nr:alpha-1,2-fucosyltransferase [Polynucleobacter sp. HIN8]BEI38377.1 alpha-1,2-fucosyltransferase [Polynucleobacter sp. HIN8]
MSKKLIVRLKGGLGNQLFCYAAARRLAWANQAELVIDNLTGFQYDHQYQRKYALDAFKISARIATPKERMEPLGRIRRYFARKIANYQPLNKQRYIHQVGIKFDPDILSLNLQEGSTYFDAFGQSELYFSDIYDLIKQDLGMAAPCDQNILDLLKKIEKTESVAIHIRWFNPNDVGHKANISLVYYANAISFVKKIIANPHFFIFSDYPDLAEIKLSPLLQKRSYSVVKHSVATEKSLTDFYIMRQCRHFIISNSTFAWWAAWLGEKSNPMSHIIAPGQTLDPNSNVTAWGFPKLIPERWIKL